MGFEGMLAVNAPTIDLTVPLIAGSVVWLVCAPVGAVLARSRNASIVLGLLMPLFCGPLGLFFVTRLPTRDELPESKRRPSLLPPSDIDVPKPIDPEIAKKLGLPPQRDSDGHLVSPPTAPATSTWSTAPPAPPAPLAPPMAPVMPVSPPPQPVGGFWANDPTGRFARRWWDGVAWTNRVAGPDGVEGIDPSG